MISQIADYLNSHGLKVKIIHQRRGPKCLLAELVWIDENQSGKLEKLLPQMKLEFGCQSIITEAVPETENLLLEISFDRINDIDFIAVTGSDEFKNNKGVLPICLGTDVEGVPQVADLFLLHHLLLIGGKEEGKTSELKSLILSLILKKKPDDLKFTLINRRGEFDVYDRQSYLLTPVIKTEEESVQFLSWLCEESQRRRLLFQQCGCRNIRDYHNHVGKLPYIVVVIDEFSELTNPIAQKYCELLFLKAGVCGIHLLLSVADTKLEKISFLRKADFWSVLFFKTELVKSSEIFSVPSIVENLLPRADSWFKGYQITGKRIHCGLVSNEKIKEIITVYNQDISKLPLAKYNKYEIAPPKDSIWNKISDWWKV